MRRHVKYQFLFFSFLTVLSFSACKKEKPPVKSTDNSSSSSSGSSGGGSGSYNPTPYQLQLSTLFQQNLPQMPMPSNNPLTVQGVKLGRKLFYDKQLSGDGNIACASCHRPEQAFSDSPNALTTFDGAVETRNTPPIINIGWSPAFFWDGRAPSAEAQALQPVVNPNEMHAISWSNVVNRLQNDPNYPSMFYAAFGTSTIDSSLVVEAIAQFERTFISDNSRMDKYLKGQLILTSQEFAGLNLFMTERGNCFHCHGSPSNPLWTDNQFHNTGLDSISTDQGLGAITGNPQDNGKFKSPTLRNLLFTAPYMHDGRFQTLSDVIDFYSTGIKESPNLDPLFYRAAQGGAHFTPVEKQELLAFLKTLTDSTFVTNPDYQAP